MTETGQPPKWATWFHDLGNLVSHVPVASTGEESCRVVVSSPTGQYTAWLIAAGALGIDTSLIAADPIQIGPRYATWHGKMTDASFVSGKSPGIVAFVHAEAEKVSADGYPARLLPDNSPVNRGGSPPVHGLRDRLRHLPGLKNSWHVWWARHCISPVVIIGDGKEYLQDQRKELLEKVPHWFNEHTMQLLSEESGQTSNAERMYFHPFMVLSPESGNNKPWLRAMKPRLVIVTSWTAYTRRHPSFFAGSPHIIITNRRVPSSLEAASALEFNHEATPWSQLPPPPGIHVRVFNERVITDSGNSDDDDESEWEL